MQSRGATPRRFDYRLIPVMALLPDIIDRAMFLLLPEHTVSARLIAHTLVFNLVLLAALIAVSRDFWIYGLASLTHLLFDLPLAPEHLFWPFLGSALTNVGISVDASTEAMPYAKGIADHFGNIFIPYRDVALRAIVLDIGGLAVLVAFFLSQRLYNRRRLRQFVVQGAVGTAGE